MGFGALVISKTLIILESFTYKPSELAPIHLLKLNIRMYHVKLSLFEPFAKFWAVLSCGTICFSVGILELIFFKISSLALFSLMGLKKRFVLFPRVILLH